MRIAFWLTTPKRIDPYRVDTTPMGGAERSAINLAKALAYKYDIDIFANSRPAWKMGNVRFLPYSDFKNINGLLPFDVLVVVRADSNILNPRKNFVLFDERPETVIVWTGDAYDQPNNQIFHDHITLREIDLIVTKSFWQQESLRMHFPLLTTVKMQTVYNGVDSTIVPRPKKIREPRFVYASTAYRGLHRFLKIWPKIKERIPDATLDCYAKTTLYLDDNPRDAEFSTLYSKVSALPGVTLKEPVSQKALLGELSDYYLMLYPNANFVESSCGVALESMACGTPVIATAMAGLKETIPMGRSILINEDPDTEEYENLFVEEVDRLWRDKNKRDEIAEYGHYHVINNYSWKKVATRWEKLLQDCQESVSESPLVKA